MASVARPERRAWESLAGYEFEPVGSAVLLDHSSLCHFTMGHPACLQSWELAFPLRPGDKSSEFVCNPEANLKENRGS